MGNALPAHVRQEWDGEAWATAQVNVASLPALLARNTGELLAVNEFNERSPMRKIAPWPFLREKRIFQRARWIGQVFLCHIHDHHLRQPGAIRSEPRVIRNEFIE